MKLREAADDLKKGFSVGGFRITAGDFVTSRAGTEVDFTIYTAFKGMKKRLLSARMFYGIEGHYMPWVEFYAINPAIDFGKTRLKFFSSTVEKKILEKISNNLGGGGAVFMEYDVDDETAYQLRHKTPIPVTRMGFLLYTLGFTWFKDFYFAEGFKEGGAKIKGEKPIDEEAKRRHIKEIRREADEFLKTVSHKKVSDDIYILNAVENARALLS